MAHIVLKRMVLTTSLFALSFGLSQQVVAEENSQNLSNEESQEVQNNSNQDKDYNDISISPVGIFLFKVS